MAYKGSKEYKKLREFLKWYSLCNALSDELSIIHECIDKYSDDVKNYFKELRGMPLKLPEIDTLQIIESLYDDIESALISTNKFNEGFNINRYLESPLDVNMRRSKFDFNSLVNFGNSKYLSFSYFSAVISQSFPEETKELEIVGYPYDNFGYHLTEPLRDVVEFIYNGGVINSLVNNSFCTEYDLNSAKSVLKSCNNYYDLIYRAVLFDVDIYKKNIDLLVGLIDEVSNKVKERKNKERIEKMEIERNRAPYGLDKAREFSEDYKPSVNSATVIISEDGVSVLSCVSRNRSKDVLSTLLYEVIPDIREGKTVLYITCRGQWRDDIFVVNKDSVDLYEKAVHDILYGR